MSVEQPQRTSNDSSWLGYLLVIGLIVGALVALNISGMRSQHEIGGADSETWRLMIVGDLYVKQALAHLPGSDPQQMARRAIRSYEKAGFYPGILRRIGVVKQSLLKQSGKAELGQLASPRFRKLVSAERFRNLTEETEMWREVYSGARLSRSDAGRFADRIETLSLGPLRHVALAEVYKRAGEPAKAADEEEIAESDARIALFAMVGLGLMLAMAGVLGLILVIMFLTRYAESLRYAPRPRIQSSVLLISFIAYFVSYVVLSLFVAIIADIAGVGDTETAPYMALSMIAMVGAFAAGMVCLKWLTSHTREDISETGLRVRSVVQGVGWGVGGYCAALPLVGVAFAITQVLSRTLLRNMPTPEHPIVQQAAGGGAALAVAVLMAVVAAPIIEEVCFRGLLYTALRGKMGVWASTFLSATIFAIIHPTFPGQFLMLFALACVLALVREKTGSLLPCIICHAINNGVAMLFVTLMT